MDSFHHSCKDEKRFALRSLASRKGFLVESNQLVVVTSSQLANAICWMNLFAPLVGAYLLLCLLLCHSNLLLSLNGRQVKRRYQASSISTYHKRIDQHPHTHRRTTLIPNIYGMGFLCIGQGDTYQWCKLALMWRLWKRIISYGTLDTLNGFETLLLHRYTP